MSVLIAEVCAAAAVVILAHGKGTSWGAARRRSVIGCAQSSIGAAERRGGFAHDRPRRWSRARPRREAPVSFELLIMQVAALLRAGLSPRDAWRQGGEIDVDEHGIPRSEALSERFAEAGTTAGAQQCAGVIAGCIVAGHSGAPLAPVLESVARTIVLAQDAQAERDAALAGPRSTARLLGWLPIMGFILAAALGADPLGFLFGHPLGLMTLLAGSGLMVIGQRWIAMLVHRAQGVGSSL